MLFSIDFKDVADRTDEFTIIDVRSPKEYQDFTITGAYNIPVFDNDERAHIGTVYRQVGQAEAIKLGIGYASKRLPSMYDQIVELFKLRKKFLIFCARGGMRSGVTGNIFNSLGFPVTRLKCGYKGYRKFVLNELPRLIDKFEYITLYGKTGTGKTHILNKISAMGHDILDLEACANHRGSLLGGIGLDKQHT